MAICGFEGNGDMYGLGIRLGYYLQWYGAIFAAWFAPTESRSLRFTNALFIAASFLALVIITARDMESLQPVEVYIILLLMFGAYLALIPIYLWRLLTKCDPYWDPTRYPLVIPGAVFANLHLLLLVGVLVYQYWFWFNRVSSLDHVNCQQYGFFFAQIRLNNKGFVAVNILVFFFLGLVCLYIIWLKIRRAAGLPSPRAKRRRHLIAHIELLGNIDVWVKIVVALTVTVATELVIDWNGIEGVNSLSSAGQTIPFLIGLGSVLRIFYVYWFPHDGNDDSDGDSYYSTEYMQPYRRPRPVDELPLPAAAPPMRPPPRTHRRSY
ncbi:uncharacterized protein BDR25DRAFT_365913 [Lindgomyces ingoldianus]|uniref:Uncharacterized protein n=1 Tax=Lindgomyces ingoldianus TaxID=673940 RepID=A0ACB6R356_9PLEO|nr:uncharacterized protein BDR25DRAFT_365913 [Lindgomyces ingoldianus]KAF2472760.1 hypothetical protein BDR25DRAFT_365913 [Lindgomyces ingoldianus]